jgi:hypothetical protein
MGILKLISPITTPIKKVASSFSQARIPKALRPWTSALKRARDANGGRGVSSFRFNSRTYVKSRHKIGGYPVYKRKGSKKKSRKSRSKGKRSKGRKNRSRR